MTKRVCATDGYDETVFPQLIFKHNVFDIEVSVD